MRAMSRPRSPTGIFSVGVVGDETKHNWQLAIVALMICETGLTI
jgi:hypothetical protein